MPFYQYTHNCGYSELLRRSVSEHILNECPSCGALEELRPVINRLTAPNIMLPSVTNQYYNNGQGRYDPGLGAWIENREQHRQEMKRQGVTEYDGTMDDYMSSVTDDKEPKDLTVEEVKDALEESSARVKNGEVFIDKPAPPEVITTSHLVEKGTK